MSDVGHHGDNAATEDFFCKFKREWVHRSLYLTLVEAHSDVLGSIDRVRT